MIVLLSGGKIMQGINGVNRLKIGAVTVLGVASMFQSGIIDFSSNIPSAFYYDSASTLNDCNGLVSSSSELQNNTTGDIIIKTNQMVDMLGYRKKIDIRLRINEVRKHISHFDFEEEYDEI